MAQLHFWESLHALVTRLGTDPLTGQTALIVGDCRGLGAAVARQLAHAGCKLALCARDTQELERARRALVSSGAAVFARACDATRPDQLEDFVHATLRRFGSLDMLVTCAEAVEPRPLEATTSLDVEHALERAFWTAYHPTMVVLPHMRARRAGRIVHIGAEARSMPARTSHATLRGFSSSLRAELAKDGVSVTSVTTQVRSGLRPESADVAARRILRAAATRKVETTLTLCHNDARESNASSPQQELLSSGSPSALLRAGSTGAN